MKYGGSSISLVKLGLSPTMEKIDPKSIISFKDINKSDEINSLRKKLTSACENFAERGPISLETNGKHPFQEQTESPADELELHHANMKLPAGEIHFTNLSVTNTTARSGAYRGINAVHALLKHPQSIQIVGATIGHLILHSSMHVKILRSTIGRLTLQDSIGELEIDSSDIGEIILPNNQSQPIVRDGAKIKDTRLASSKQQNPYYSGPQRLRDLLSMLEETHNSSAAHIVRADVLRAEYPDETGVMKVVSWFYGLSCDYGRKPGRAFLWIAALFAVTAATAFTEILPNPSIYDWQSWPKFLNDLGEALGFASQNIMLPFSVFGKKFVFSAQTNTQQLIGVFQSFLNLALYAVIAISVRRRFRIT